jgi:capsular exopolysaccharide synthesis family protein
VLLIDADFRRPRIAALFHMESSAGMAEVMMGRLAWRDALTTTPVPGLTVLPSGRPPANPAELLSSPRFAALIATLREEFQYVIIDTPPLLAVSDPCAVAAVADGVILNIRLRRNARPLAAAAAQLLESVKARVVGVVVNGVGNANRYGYHNSKYSAYYHDARVPAPEPLANDSDLDLPALVAPRTRSRLSS